MGHFIIEFQIYAETLLILLAASAIPIPVFLLFFKLLSLFKQLLAFGSDRFFIFPYHDLDVISMTENDCVPDRPVNAENWLLIFLAEQFTTCQNIPKYY